MVSTLRELNDSVGDLQELEEQLSQGLIPVKYNGGARHATAVITARTLAVVQRKAALLESVRNRTVALLAAHGQFEEMLPGIVAGEVQPPECLKGIKRFVDRHTHSPGNPVDANRVNFKAFVSSFKL